MALADIFSLMLITNGVKNVQPNSEIIRSWGLDALADALGAPIKMKPHRQGGIYGSEVAAIFAKELK
jgi:hypothetical protein